MALSKQYYSAAPSAVLLLLYAAIYIFNVGMVDGAASQPTEVTAGVRALLHFEAQHRVWAIVISMALILAGAITFMRVIIRYSVFNEASHLPMLIYVAVFATFASAEQIIAPSVVALLMVLSLENIYDRYNLFDSAPKIFSGAFWLGTILLIYPAAALLTLIFFVSAVIFERSGREAIISLLGIATPVAIALYVGWIFTESIIAQLANWGAIFVSSSTWSIASSPQLFIAIIFVLLSSMYAVYNIEEISLSLLSRNRVRHSMSLIVLASAMLFVPSFTPAQFGVVAAPFALAMSTLLFELRGRAVMIVYTIFLVVTLLVRVLP